MNLLTGPRRMLATCLRPLVSRAARAYVAGDTLTDALAVSDALFDRGLGTGLCYWNSPGESPRRVSDMYLAALEALSRRDHAYLSIKLPAIGCRHELMAEIVERSIANRVRLYVDALEFEQADTTRSVVDYFLDSGADISVTLPGRWERSLIDAEWAIENALTVRVVKGQWADPADTTRNLRDGFLAVVDALAGRARHVALASHDVPLVAEAVRRLRDRGTSCEMELLYGLPTRASLQQADALGLGVHVYVPYGKSFLPYALGRLGHNPRLLWWFLRDLLMAREAPIPQINPREFSIR